MKVLAVEQGSPEWHDVRLGIPTASQFDRLITPKTHQPSASATGYRNELLAAWLLGHPIEFGSSGWMDRGTSMEAEARRWYEFDRDTDVETPGFILRPDGKVGGSPDGLVGSDGGLEIKCLAVQNHVGYLVGDDPDYIGQVQGYMYLTGRQWWDVLLYNPDLPKVVKRVERDEKYITALMKALDSFVEDLDRCKERLREHKRPPPNKPEPFWAPY